MKFLKPLVSILIPAFNAQEWIADTLRSALAQTWDKTEIIVVDDGSSDQTVSIARQFESDRVRIVAQENQGPSAARNTALRFSRGEYIQWLDADDLLAPDKILRQIEALKNCESRRTLFSSAWGHFLYSTNRAVLVPTPLWCDLTPAEWLVRKMSHNLYMANSSFLVSRELTEAAGPWDAKLVKDNDGEYFCRVILRSDGVRFIPESKVYYRLSGTGSVSHMGRNAKKLEAQWRSMQLHIMYLRSLEDTPRVRAACVQYLKNWLIDYYPERRDIVAEMGGLAETLGGHLDAPRLSWKYSWIKSLFGWRPAKRARLVLPRVKSSVARYCDYALFRLEKH